MDRIATRLLVLLLCWIANVVIAGGPALERQAYDRRPFERMVVFGDSLSDPGNAYALLGQVARPPYDLIPSAPYARGGFHFSDGPTWIEQLSWRIGLRKDAGPALRAPGRFWNYAVGAARARASGSYTLNDQLQLLMQDSGGWLPADGLYVIAIGGNDVRDALLALQSDPSGATSAAIIAAAITAVADSITALAAGGAQQFMIANVPNLAWLPAVRQQGPQAQFAATQLTVGYTQALSDTLIALQAALPVRFFEVDLFALIDQVVMDPLAVGFKDVENSCVTPGVLLGALCKQPGRYLFWDGIHPTFAGHRLLAKTAAGVLGIDRPRGCPRAAGFNLSYNRSVLHDGKPCRIE